MTENEYAAAYVAEQNHPEARDSGLLCRSFEAEITPGDGRTIDVRVVPYNTVARVSDFGGPIYSEEWAPGCFDDQMQAANRLLANVEHEIGIGGVVARGVKYWSDPGAFNATVRMLKGQDADKTLELVNDGVFDGISLEALPKKSVRTATGVVRRVKGHLDKIAFCRNPAYTNARVLAVREQPEILLDEELLPIPIDPELVERCRRLGVALPAHLQAHPVDTGTPAPSGTPEDDTRRESESTSSEVSAP